MIHLAEASKRFGPVEALGKISFKVERGEKWLILGPNGSGKSTLLKLCAGLIRPSQGSATIDMRPPRENRRNLGYLGHDPYLYPYLTVRENIVFYAQLFQVDPGMGLEVAEEFDLGRRMDSPVGGLSRGEIQKAALVRTMLHRPALLLLDEPFAGLDEISTDKLERLLDRSEATVVVASHLVTPRLSGWERVQLSEGRLS